MTQINRQTLPTIRDDMNAALRAVAEKHGLAINVGDCSFTEATATFKVLVAMGGENGESAQALKAQADWRTYASAFGLDAAWLGRTFTNGGNTFRIDGLLPNKRAKPILVTRTDNGKQYVFRVEDVTLRMRAAS